LNADVSWASLFTAYHGTDAGAPVPAHPQVAPKAVVASEGSRYLTLTNHFLTYYWRERSVYQMRILLYAIMAIFLGTLYLRIGESTNNVPEIAGAAFFSIYVILFFSVANVAVHSFDRFVMVNGYASNQFALSTWSLAQFTAALPYTLAGALVYQLIFHWLAGLNDSFASFIYQVLLAMVLQWVMEAIDWAVIETMQNAMLSVTMSMVQLGSLFLYSGFFIRPGDMVPAISWLTYILPTRYLLRGSFVSYFDGQDFYDPPTNTSISGKDVLDTVFDIDVDKNNEWLMLLVGVAFVLFFRLNHWMSMWNNLRKMGAALTNKEDDGAEASAENSSGVDHAQLQLAQAHLTTSTEMKGLNNAAGIAAPHVRTVVTSVDDLEVPSISQQSIVTI